MSMNTYAESNGAAGNAGSSHEFEQAFRSISKQARAARAAHVVLIARYISPVILFSVLMIGGAHWAVTREADAASRAEAASEATPATAPSEYFPHQYVNQAQQAEDHIQAF